MAPLVMPPRKDPNDGPASSVEAVMVDFASGKLCRNILPTDQAWLCGSSPGLVLFELTCGFVKITVSPIKEPLAKFPVNHMVGSLQDAVFKLSKQRLDQVTIWHQRRRGFHEPMRNVTSK